MTRDDEAQIRDLASTRAALLREIGPPTDRDNQWQPMVSAGEVRTLLDALDDQDAQIHDLLEEREELLTEIRRLQRGSHPAGRALLAPEVWDRATVHADNVVALREALTERDAGHEGGGGA